MSPGPARQLQACGAHPGRVPEGHTELGPLQRCDVRRLKRSAKSASGKVGRLLLCRMEVEARQRRQGLLRKKDSHVVAQMWGIS